MISRNSAEQLLQPGVRRREVLAWAMYDFANSGYTTVVLTAVYAVYFVKGIAQGASWGTLAWTLSLCVSYFLVMVTMPVLGAWADARACKKKALVLSTLLCILATLALYFPQPGDVLLAGALVALSNLFYSYGESLIAAFLPELARPQATGRLSGLGWGVGYIGGMLTMGLCLAWVLHAESKGQGASMYVPVTMVMVAGVYLLAACVTFVGLRERATPAAKPYALSVSWVLLPRKVWHDLRHSLAQLKEYPDLFWLLRSIVAWQAGVAVAISLAAVYAVQVIGFSTAETMMLILALNLAAALGAVLCGMLQDRMGHVRILSWTLAGWALTCLTAAWSSSRLEFWGAATLAGLCMGSSQSIARAMVGVLAPTSQRAEFFGLWSFAVRLASGLGPVTYGLITWMSAGNHRLAVLGTSIFFGLGWLMVRRVNMVRGMQRAGHATVEAAV